MESTNRLTQCTPIRRGLVVPPGNLVAHPKWKGSDLMQSVTGNSNTQVVFVGDIGVSDFHPSCYSSVIYITENDIISNTDYKRRIAKLRNAFGFTEKHVLVDKTTLTEDKYISIQEIVVFDCDMNIFPVEGTQQAAEYLTQMVVQAMKTPGRNIYTFKCHELPCKDTDILAVVESFPRIGKTKAKMLLETFGSIEGIADASISALSKLIGRSGAQTLHAFLH
ncbi:Fanconi anemia core complex-associated protein 24-like [Clavelina lepadiformis]|uniref:Fanconi anemia core complex-associated protein 24-like n=1 Tax=Clavelina lepadiformis TaxID=159417 RepID=UPI00404185B8